MRATLAPIFLLAIALLATPTRAEILAAGPTHACHVNNDARVACWGKNTEGQLGDNTTDEAIAPVRILSQFSGGTTQPFTNVAAVTAGDRHSCALKADGTVWCWGANDQLQLGGSTSTPHRPNQVPGQTSIAEVSAGGEFSCSRSNAGALSCWGTVDPLNASGLLDMDVGGRQVCMVNADRSVSCALNETKWTLATVPGVTNAVEVKVGGANGTPLACARKQDGSVMCWGHNGQGQLGRGTTNGSVQGAAAVSGVSGAKALSVGAAHACIINAQDELVCWGDNDERQSGHPDTLPNQLVPYGVLDTSGSVALAAGGEATCFAEAGSDVKCFGLLDRLGTGLTSARGIGPVHNIGTSFLNAGNATVGVGVEHACVRTDNARIRCWGGNTFGQLGSGNTSAQSAPFELIAPTNVSGMAVGDFHTCAIKNDSPSTVWCWGNDGSNRSGVIANGDAPVLLPTQVKFKDNSPFTGAVAISAGREHTCALKGNEIWCWGSNSLGQLGAASAVGDEPVKVDSTAQFTSVSAGGTHTCATTTINTQVLCWGGNGSGQLGVAANAGPNTTPQGTTLSSSVTSISAGWAHTCAVLSAGQAFCWGQNLNGQLGIGNTTSTHNASLVSGGFLFDRISAGTDHTCAVHAGNKRAWCWGANESDQLGFRGPQTQYTTPQELLDREPARIAAGDTSSCLQTSHGTVTCMGFRGEGALGDAARFATEHPQLAGVGNVIIKVGVGSEYGEIEDGPTVCTAGAYRQIGFNVSEISQPIQTVQFEASVRHKHANDLAFELRSPGASPTSVSLFIDAAPSAAAHGDYAFNDAAFGTWAVAAGGAGANEPVTSGAYRPNNGAVAMSAFNALTVNQATGSWIARIRDECGVDIGHIDRARLIIRQVGNDVFADGFE